MLDYFMECLNLVIVDKILIPSEIIITVNNDTYDMEYYKFYLVFPIS